MDSFMWMGAEGSLPPVFGQATTLESQSPLPLEASLFVPRGHDMPTALPVWDSLGNGPQAAQLGCPSTSTLRLRVLMQTLLSPHSMIVVSWVRQVWTWGQRRGSHTSVPDSPAAQEEDPLALPSPPSHSLVSDKSPSAVALLSRGCTWATVPFPTASHCPRWLSPSCVLPLRTCSCFPSNHTNSAAGSSGFRDQVQGTSVPRPC